MKLFPQGSTRESIAVAYRLGIADQSLGDFVDWPIVNKALLKRYTKSGLIYIKRRAWKQR